MTGFRAYLAALVRHDRRGFAWVATVQTLATAGQGVGLLLLVPLLEVAGITAGSQDGLSRFWLDMLDAIGVPLSLVSMLVAYVVVVALSASLTAYSNVLLTRYRLSFVDALRERLYQAIAAAEWRHLLALRQSDLLTTLTVNVNEVSVGTYGFLELGVSAFLVSVQVAVALRLSAPLTAVAVVTGGALLALVWPLVRRSRVLGRELVDRNRGVLASVTGFLDGLKLAKAHGLERAHVDAFGDAITQSRRSQVSFAKATALSTAVQLSVTAGVLAVLVYVAVERLSLAPSALLVLAYIFSRVVPQITNGQRSLHHLARSLPSFEDLSSLLGEVEAAHEPDAPTHRATPAIAEAITLDNVGFAYGEKPVLQDVSLTIEARRTTALVGPSGAGKTTLADIVVGLLTPTRGRVLVDGEPLEDLRAWRSAIALVPQDPFLFHDTIRANLRWARPYATDDELWHALDTAAATGFVRETPDGLDTIVGDRGMRLSGGERQRIALARALLREPQLLVLDEATSSLDTEHERSIHEALARIKGRMTILLIAHRLSTVHAADAIVVLDGGTVVETGTWHELAERPEGRLRQLIAAGAVE